MDESVVTTSLPRVVPQGTTTRPAGPRAGRRTKGTNLKEVERLLNTRTEPLTRISSKSINSPHVPIHVQAAVDQPKTGPGTGTTRPPQKRTWVFPIAPLCQKTPIALLIMSKVIHKLCSATERLSNKSQLLHSQQLFLPSPTSSQTRWPWARNIKGRERTPKMQTQPEDHLLGFVGCAMGIEVHD